MNLLLMQVFWVVGPTTVLIVTAFAMLGLFAVDFVPVPNTLDLHSLQDPHRIP